MNTWRKAKTFVCPTCEKDFSKESALKKHMKDAHNTKLERKKKT